MILQNLSIIVAIDERNAIGNKGQLLCHLPDDLRHFKELTTGHTVIMGRKTYESLPKRPLPNRLNVVLTGHMATPDDAAEQLQIVNSIEEIYSIVHATKEEVFVIGGQSLYESLMHEAGRLYITRIQHRFTEADAFFPDIDNAEWNLLERVTHPADERHEFPFVFETYEKNI